MKKIMDICDEKYIYIKDDYTVLYVEQINKIW